MIHAAIWVSFTLLGSSLTSSGFLFSCLENTSAQFPGDLPWREAGLGSFQSSKTLFHQVWCEWHPQDTILREGVSWGSLGSFTRQLTLPEQLLNGGPSVWALGRWRPMAQLTQGHHRVHFTCFSGVLSVSAEITRAFQEPSGALHCLGITGPPLTSLPQPAASVSL